MNDYVIERRKIVTLKPAGYNPRKITDWEMRKIMRSLEAFGWAEPIVINKDGTIIGGHQRVKAAEHLGWEEVPCRVYDLPKPMEKALNLALNRLGGEFDEGLLATMLTEMEASERMLSGFDENETAKMLGEEMKKAEEDKAKGGEDGDNSGARVCETCNRPL
jgi:ParB-like chromosome segregation protein Spo0J